jgi:hypothetical protein
LTLDRPGTVERLREALISLERSRRRERELRAIEASMVDVVRVLALAEHRGGTFGALLEALRHVLPFEEAAILVPEADGSFEPAACTNEWLAALHLPPGRMLARVVSGEIVVAFDASLIPEWRAQPAAVRARARSVMHVPLHAGGSAVLFVCTHSAPARFEQRHIDMVKRLIPLAGQILRRLELRESLAAHEERERRERLALFDAIVEHLPAGVLVEDERRRVYATNELLHTTFAIPGDFVGMDGPVLHERFARLTTSPSVIAVRTEQIVRAGVAVSGEELKLLTGRTIERDYVPVAMTSAGLIAHFWQYRDVTVRRRADEPRRATAYQDALVAALPAAPARR